MNFKLPLLLLSLSNFMWFRKQFFTLLGQLFWTTAAANPFSRVRLCATPEMAAHQAPPSLGFSSKNTGVGCHFLLQCMKVKSQSEVAQSCPTPSDPMDCSPPGSSVHGIFQARVLEWGAIAFSDSEIQYTSFPRYIHEQDQSLYYELCTP